ncbi:hypothetical protein RDn1_275 [Candidatus Termititenax dinenymphae]|uniref:Uncharacterized protein n=1 Tax=Candidatus Termititenax dinenymphae TaxID=2218523 RepID=A0A388TKQ8_9BACT|nr:hypothetical protein RDn1_275 [Candidatus Termititenax dinenymphae]
MSPVFDYETISRNLHISRDVIGKFEKEAMNEFPQDNMLRELHILRALKAYASTRK